MELEDNIAYDCEDCLMWKWKKHFCLILQFFSYWIAGASHIYALLSFISKSLQEESEKVFKEF